MDGRRAVVAVAFLLAAQVSAQRIEPAFHRQAVGEKQYPDPPRLSQRADVVPAFVLSAATRSVPEEIAAIEQWNRERRLPSKNGFTRRFPETLQITLGQAAVAKDGVARLGGGVVSASERGIVWSGSFVVEESYRLRLHLQNVHLPAGAVLWVWGKGEAPVAFDSDLIDAEGGLWTPSVSGDTISLELEIPRSSADPAARLTIGEFLEIVGPRRTVTASGVHPEDASVCLIDATCISTSTYDAVVSTRAATAQLQFVKNGGGYVCSGGLLNERNGSGTPYLLTANHCFSTSPSATSLEAFWDYQRPSCNGSIPSFSSLRRSNGSALLTTSEASDFTFVKLNSIPGGRWLLGWDTATPANGTTLYRISYPFPDDMTVPRPQSYSSTLFSNTTDECQARPRPQYVYSTAVQGGTYGGSSGSPVLIAGGYVVGQLFGACGPLPEAGCDARNYTVDGAFRTTYASIKPYLESSGTQPPPLPPCAPSATQVCLNGDRFSVKVDWKTSGGQTGQGQAIKYTPNSALFWFFGADNIEMLVKVLTGCPLSNTYWVFSAATTDVEYTITVTDTKSGRTKTYFHAGGTAAPAITDTSAFATCP
jgi:hypothetical protein